jgi:hypothetical protein
LNGSLFSAVVSAFELLSYIAVCLGIPVAIWQFRRAAQKEQADREYGTYNALDEKYLEFQQLCLEMPRLDVFDLADPSPVSLTPLEKKQELVAFTMLFSIFERSFLMYADQSTSIKKRQWMGWERYVMDYCARGNFRSAWRLSGNTFDTAYQTFMEQCLERARNEMLVTRATPSSIYTMRLIHSSSHPDYIASMASYAECGDTMCPIPTNHIAYWLENHPVGPWRLLLTSFLCDSSLEGFVMLILLRRADVVLISLVLLARSVAPNPQRLRLFYALLKELLQQEGLAERHLLLEIPSTTSSQRDKAIRRLLSRFGFSPLSCPYERPLLAVGREAAPKLVPASLYRADGGHEASATDLRDLLSALYLDFYLEWASLGQRTNPLLRAKLEAALARCVGRLSSRSGG